MQIQSSVNKDPYKVALTCHQKKEYAQAKSLYLAVLKRESKRAEAWVNLASVCDALGEREEALKHVEHALALDPSVRDGYFNKGVILEHLSRFQEAIPAFQKSLQRSPKDYEAHHYLGQCYFKLKEFDLALKAYTMASDICPNWNSIYAAGKCYQRKNQFLKAIVCFSECIKIAEHHPKLIKIQFELVMCYKQVKDYPTLLTLLSALPEIIDLSLEEQQEIFFTRQEWYLWAGEETMKQQLAHSILQNLETATAALINPWRSIVLPLSLSEQLRLARLFAASIEKKYEETPCHLTVAKTKSKRLKIAYLSMDFRVHASSFLMQSLFGLHDKTRFEVFAYSYGPDDKSEIRQTIAQTMEHFIDVRNEEPLRTAQRIAKDEIDILIDLTGFMADHRFDILALRPAPIQVNYLGYCLSTGSKAIDYFLADEVIVQKEEEVFYSEKIVYLPHTFMCLNHQEKINTTLAKTRAYWGLPEKAFVYGCFNAAYKIEPKIFSAWLDILKAVPDSVLWLLTKHDMMTHNLKKEAEKRDFDPKRLVFSSHIARDQHLARHQHMDLFLDTWQVNAVTTASDAICAGVPVLTLAGTQILSRAGKSIVQAAGMPELTQAFIASDSQDYVQKAIAFGLESENFSILKKTFQAQLPHSPLLAMPEQVKAMEAAYEKMWTLYQQGLAPQSFKVNLKSDECIV